MQAAKKVGWLERFALDDRAKRAWALYDWANSAMFTVVVTAVFPAFYKSVAAAGLSDDAQRRWYGWATTGALLVAALLSPLLGALADVRPIKKELFGIFLGLGVVATATLFTVGAGDAARALALFALINIAAASSFVFYDALLPYVAREDEIDRLSTSAYALGYLGGGLCLGSCVLLILQPAWFGLDAGEGAAPDARTLPTRLSFVIVALWWLAFSVPLFVRVREPAVARESDENATDHPVAVAWTRLRETFGELRGYRNAFLLMLAFFLYNDGIGTIIRMAVIFGEERRIDAQLMLVCILVVQFVGIPFTIAFGRLAGVIGAKRAILVALAAYVGITLFAFQMRGERDFVVMAVAVGMVQGGAQALSRSLFASLIPKHKSGEFFGLFATLEKFAGILGPLVFSLAPSSGIGILSLIVFFVGGAGLLMLVDVEQGRRVAREADATTVDSLHA